MGFADYIALLGASNLSGDAEHHWTGPLAAAAFTAAVVLHMVIELHSTVDSPSAKTSNYVNSTTPHLENCHIRK